MGPGQAARNDNGTQPRPSFIVHRSSFIVHRSSICYRTILAAGPGDVVRAEPFAAIEPFVAQIFGVER
jgi:hypothetical protein